MAALGLTLALVAPAVAGAIVTQPGDGTLESLAFVGERVSPRSDVDLIQESQAQPEVRQAVADFRTEAGGEWTTFVDRRTGLVEAVAGSGIPWIPGRGNQLTLDDISASLKGGTEVNLAALESIARGFLPRVAPMLGVKPAQLVLNQERSRQIADYLWRVDFDVVRGGLPVEGAYVAFTVNHGNLIQIESEKIPALGSTVPKAEIKRQQALSILARFVDGFSAADTFLDGGSMHLLSVAEADAGQPDGFARGRGILPAWEFTFVREGSDATWRARVDAVKGEVLDFVDTNDYANAYIRGGAMFLGTQATRPMPYANRPVLFSNSSGVYPYPGAATNSTLAGQFVRILDVCGAINMPSATVGGVPGIIDFGISPANNCSTPGVGGAGNTRSARTQFYHLNRAKDMARGWLTSAWLNAQLTANVNINSTCNAFWNGSTVNFYRSGGGCGNTGEIEAVALHEYGHGLDQNDGNGTSLDRGTGETYGDFTAALVTHRSCIGAGFFTGGGNCGGYGDPCLSCTGVRDIDWGAHASNTPHTVANFTQTNCPTSTTYQGPCGREGHCESYISSEAVWDLAARDLPSPGSPQAWSTADRLWHLSRPSANKGFVCVTSTSTWSSHGCAAGTYWRAMRAVDDDDGNLANGTPNGAALYAAFNRHLIACTTDAGASTGFAGCTPPPTPTLTLTPGDDQASITWTPAAGAVYDVFRNDLGCNFGMAKVANDVAGPTFTDTTVANDVAYSYLVVAHASGNQACSATASLCQNVTPRHRTDLWIKDLPADVGLEPDPALAGQPMWTSPDIWVRNTNTAGPHENPEFGSINFVKATIRNRSIFTAYNAEVKFYYADASAGLDWDTDWTLIDTAVVPSLVGSGTTEVTVQWSPPGTGHYCLVARIVTPQDPMTYAETINIDYNTRYNNNIAWRNVNVVNLVPFAAGKAEFIARNPFLDARTIRLVIREGRGVDTDAPFLNRGTVRIVLPDEVVARLEEQGIEPQGFTRIDGRTFQLDDPKGGSFELFFEGRAEFPVGIQFEDKKWTPPTEDDLDRVPTTTFTIEAVEQDAKTGEEIGGVAYLVSTRAN